MLKQFTIIVMILFLISLPLGGLDLILKGHRSPRFLTLGARLRHYGYVIRCFLIESRFAFIFGAFVALSSPVMFVITSIYVFLEGFYFALARHFRVLAFRRESPFEVEFSDDVTDPYVSAATTAVNSRAGSPINFDDVRTRLPEGV